MCGVGASGDAPTSYQQLALKWVTVVQLLLGYFMWTSLNTQADQYGAYL